MPTSGGATSRPRGVGALDSRPLGWAARPITRCNPNPMTVIGLHHADVHVASLERSNASYQAVFGLRLAERLSLGAEQLTFLEAGRSRVELIADGAAARATGVVDHLAFDDLDDMFCLGLDGERIELFEQCAPDPVTPPADVEGGP